MKIENPKMEVEASNEMNDKDYLNDVLESEKNLSNNLSISVNEMSNDDLFEEILDMLDDSKEVARDLYNLAFKMGWYSVDSEDKNNIDTKYSELNTLFDELK